MAFNPDEWELDPDEWEVGETAPGPWREGYQAPDPPQKAGVPKLPPQGELPGPDGRTPLLPGDKHWPWGRDAQEFSERMSGAAGIAVGGVAGLRAGTALRSAATQRSPGLASLLQGKGLSGSAARVGAAGVQGGVEGAVGSAVTDLASKTIDEWTPEDLEGVRDRAMQSGGIGSLLGSGAQAAGEVVGGLSRLLRGGLRKSKPLRTLDDNPEYVAAEKARIKAGQHEKGTEGVEQVRREGASRVNELAMSSAPKVGPRIDEVITRPAGEAHGKALAAAGKRPVATQDIREEIFNEIMKQTSPSTGELMGTPAAQGRAKTLMAVMESLPEGATVDDVVALRRSIGDSAGFSSASPTPRQEASQTAYHALRSSVRKPGVAPELATADDAYTQAMGKRERLLDIATGRESGGRASSVADPLLDGATGQALRPADEMGIARRLSQAGDDMGEGVNIAPRLEELRQADPEGLGKILDDIIAAKAGAQRDLGLKEALESTRFGVDKFATSWSPENALFRGLVNSSRAMGRRAMSAARAGERAPAAAVEGVARAAPVLSPGLMRLFGRPREEQER